MSDLKGFQTEMNGSRSSLDPQSLSVPDPLRCASGLRSGPCSYLHGRSVPESICYLGSACARVCDCDWL